MSANKRSPDAPISVILAGFGNWARTRTVAPYLSFNKRNIRVVAASRVLENSWHRNGDPFHFLPPPELAKFDEIEAAIPHAKSYPDPKALIINTPNALHFTDALVALEHGFHVYVERPIVTPTHDLAALLTASTKRNLSLFTGVQRRLEIPFQYIFDAVTKRLNFNTLRTIRCWMSVGQNIEGWRLDPMLAGGGVLIDNGFHLLDIAAWVTQAVGVCVPDFLRGFVHLEDMLSSPNGSYIEQTAIGSVRLGRDVRLSFDFTYRAPLGSIYERIDFRDEQGGQVSVTRDLYRRTKRPGKVRHQCFDGTTVETRLPNGQTMLVDDTYLADQPRNVAPLEAFFDSINDPTQRYDHPCCAHQSLSTWRLLRNIYDIASTQGRRVQQ